MKDTLEQFKDYVENLTPEQTAKDWEELKDYSKIGPTCDEYFAQVYGINKGEDAESYGVGENKLLDYLNLQPQLKEGSYFSFDISEKFDEIAYEMMNKYGILCNGKIYKFLEIEFYHNSLDEGTFITYPRFCDAGCWFSHKTGMDLTFKSDKLSYGGILIRAIKDEEGNLICGPVRVLTKVFGNLSAFSVSQMPTVVALPEDMQTSYVPAKMPRFNLKDDMKPYRYAAPESMFPKPSYSYKAWPWKNKS